MRDLLPKIEQLSAVYALPVLLMLVGFIAIVVWTYRAKRKAEFEQAAKLPLENE